MTNYGQSRRVVLPLMEMKCPRCVQKIHRAADACPHCGFTLADAEAHFGGVELNLRCLADAAGLLRRGERERVEAAMERLSRRFPQLFVAIYTGAFDGAAELRQFGFWLLNRATFAELPPEQSNAAGILITLDPATKMAGVTYGYLLDPYLTETDTFDCLWRAHSHWLEGRYADGMIKALEQFACVLRKRSRQARRHPASFQRKLQPPAHDGRPPHPPDGGMHPVACPPPSAEPPS